jgi:hypothetical protein
MAPPHTLFQVGAAVGIPQSAEVRTVEVRLMGYLGQLAHPRMSSSRKLEQRSHVRADDRQHQHRWVRVLVSASTGVAAVQRCVRAALGGMLPPCLLGSLRVVRGGRHLSGPQGSAEVEGGWELQAWVVLAGGMRRWEADQALLVQRKADNLVDRLRGMSVLVQATLDFLDTPMDKVGGQVLASPLFLPLPARTV